MGCELGLWQSGCLQTGNICQAFAWHRMLWEYLWLSLAPHRTPWSFENVLTDLHNCANALTTFHFGALRKCANGLYFCCCMGVTEAQQKWVSSSTEFQILQMIQSKRPGRVPAPQKYCGGNTTILQVLNRLAWTSSAFNRCCTWESPRTGLG